jgi:hypothetical protein
VESIKQSLLSQLGIGVAEKERDQTKIDSERLQKQANFNAMKSNFLKQQRFLQMAVTDNGLHLWKCLIVER